MAGQASPVEGRHPLGRRRILLLLVTRDLKVKYAGLGPRLLLVDPRAAHAGRRLLVRLHQADAAARLGEAPYVVFLLCGMLPWQCANALAAVVDEGAVQGRQAGALDEPAARDLGSAHGRVEDGGVPVQPARCIAFFAILTGAHLTWYVVFFPLALLIQVVLLIGFGLILAPLSVLYSDVEPRDAASCCGCCSTSRRSSTAS